MQWFRDTHTLCWANVNNDRKALLLWIDFSLSVSHFPAFSGAVKRSRVTRRLAVRLSCCMVSSSTLALFFLGSRCGSMAKYGMFVGDVTGRAFQRPENRIGRQVVEWNHRRAPLKALLKNCSPHDKDLTLLTPAFRSLVEESETEMIFKLLP